MSIGRRGCRARAAVRDRACLSGGEPRGREEAGASGTGALRFDGALRVSRVGRDYLRKAARHGEIG